jgi:exodeoxyribonuclease VII large subunit
MNSEIVFAPSDFVAVFNQTLEAAYPSVVIEGELSDFRVSRNRWVYFSLKDELASVKFFGSVYALPGPLEDGLKLRAVGVPRLHPQYGFSINFSSLQPVGEGAIKKAADLLRVKLEAEGLFDPARKRPLPDIPRRIGLVTAASSAAAADFTKILGERWGGVEIMLADVLVQGEKAPSAIVSALNYFEQANPLPDVIVVSRGGGSPEELAVFNDERVVRAVAGSRTPTLVAIGHEIDISLAELAADQRASTPTNAAQLVVPDRSEVISRLSQIGVDINRGLKDLIRTDNQQLQRQVEILSSTMELLAADAYRFIAEQRKLISIFDPRAALKRGYAIVQKGKLHVSRRTQVRPSDRLSIELSDGKINAVVE